MKDAVDGERLRSDILSDLTAYPWAATLSRSFSA